MGLSEEAMHGPITGLHMTKSTNFSSHTHPPSLLSYCWYLMYSTLGSCLAIMLPSFFFPAVGLLNHGNKVQAAGEQQEASHFSYCSPKRRRAMSPGWRETLH